MISDFQRENLAQLSQFLRDNAETLNFDMREFRTNDVNNDAATVDRPCHHTCGSVGCAIGWGPAAGIKPTVYENWFQYGHRVFGAHNEGLIWFGLFSPAWARHDNTPAGAADRIDRFLTTGELRNPRGTLLTDE